MTERILIIQHILQVIDLIKDTLIILNDICCYNTLILHLSFTVHPYLLIT